MSEQKKTTSEFKRSLEELDYEELPDHTWEFIDEDPGRSEAVRAQYNKKVAAPGDMEIGDGLGLRLLYLGLRGELRAY